MALIHWLRLHAQRARIKTMASPRRSPARYRCEVDDWTFDARYTQGRCPICGWAPDGAPTAPRWLALVNVVDWQVIGLVLLADVLALLGLIVANAAGLLPVHR